MPGRIDHKREQERKINAAVSAAAVNKKLARIRSKGGVSIDWDDAIKRLHLMLDNTSDDGEICDKGRARDRENIRTSSLEG